MSVVGFGMRHRFDAAAAGDLEATFELIVSDARYAVLVSGGRCRVEQRPAPEATARVRIGRGDLIRLISGRTPWTTLLAEDRLELTGDPFLALRFPQLFGVSARR